MPCYYPIQCHSDGLTENGKKQVIFKSKNHKDDRLSFKISCGTCTGCRLERSRQWALRCVHEAQLHANNSFITLTYAPDKLPEGGTLVPAHFKRFIKELRRKTRLKIRYFHCGEYGKKLSRPHYHALIFGYNFPDRILFKEHPFRWYTSELLQKLWPHGFSIITDLTPATASYVARYTLKKVYGINSNSHYAGKHPEYITMSRMPGLGSGWYSIYKGDIYPEGVYTTAAGYKTSPPKYYDRLYEAENPIQMYKIKLDRQARASHNTVKDTYNGLRIDVSNADNIRLPIRERVKLSQLRQLKRTLEDSDDLESL